MLSLLFAASILTSSVTNECPTCEGVGRVKLPCPECKGKGTLNNRPRYSESNYGSLGFVTFKPCPRCASNNQLVGPRQKSSGLIDVKCPICDGKKKVSDEVLKVVLKGRKGK